jgi:putative transposase
MYEWRKLSVRQRKRILAVRKERRFPWHRPPHMTGAGWYHLTAACHEHRNIVGASDARMTAFADGLLRTLDEACGEHSLAAWCVLPNHYHLLVLTPTPLQQLTMALGKLHGRTSREWNLEEDKTGRTCWYAAADRGIRSDGHYWAAMNYIHHNPVKHGHAQRWQDWPWSSARDFLSQVPREEAERLWKDYPVLDMGKGWDD